MTNTVITVTKWKNNIQQQNPGLTLEVIITGPEIYNLDPEAEADWQNVTANKPFSEVALSFIADAMADLYYWETFKD